MPCSTLCALHSGLAGAPLAPGGLQRCPARLTPPPGRARRLSAYWLGKSAHTWHRWFTLKACVLFTVRFFVYRSKVGRPRGGWALGAGCSFPAAAHSHAVHRPRAPPPARTTPRSERPQTR